jgi:RimJ/RimL family protein N-acetyltransferase
VNSNDVPTGMPDLVLRPFELTDNADHFTLVQANAAHLTRLGDYEGDVALDLSGWTERFSEPHARDGLFRIVVGDMPVGLIHLGPVDPPRFGLGYWLAETATGRGYATAAVRAILDYAQTRRAATDVFAGVTHGNDKSSAVLARCGFTPVADFDRYTRWHRHVSTKAEPH